ncbi:hypothetical protein, partial [Tumebacillus lipolyticus]
TNVPAIARRTARFAHNSTTAMRGGDPMKARVEIVVEVEVDVPNGATDEQRDELATKEAINIINAGGAYNVYIDE